MKYCLVVFLTFNVLISQAQNKFNPVLKRQLDSVYVLDQKYRDLLSQLMDPSTADKVAKSYSSTPSALMGKFWTMQNRIDSMNVIFVEAVIKRYGYPGTTLVGKESNEDAWCVIQHSKDITAYIPIMKVAAEKGELPFNKYAMMYDRYLLNHNKPQVYGSQSLCNQLKNGSNECIVWPIEDAANVNARRKKAGFSSTVEENAARLGVKYRVVTMDEVKGLNQ